MHVERYEADNLIFTDQRVCIILDGAAELRQHFPG